MPEIIIKSAIAERFERFMAGGRVLLLDDLQNMQDENDWNALCELIRSGADRRFVLLSPWHAAGLSDCLPVQ